MVSPNALGDIVAALFDRRLTAREFNDTRDIGELCSALLAEENEATSLQLANAVLNRYSQMTAHEKFQFFEILNDGFDIDPREVERAARAYQDDNAGEKFRALVQCAEPRRQELLRRLNQVPGATAELVRMRADLLKFLKNDSKFARTDFDFVHFAAKLVQSWVSCSETD